MKKCSFFFYGRRVICVFGEFLGILRMQTPFVPVWKHTFRRRDKFYEIMIRNLMFDLGGVIMNIRREDCVEAFRRLGMADPDKFLGEYSQSGPFAAIENGSSTPERFRDEVRAIIGNPDLSDGDIDHAFGEFLKGIPSYRLEALRRLRKNYKLYMLSNTNPIMWADGIARNFRQEGKDVDYYFDGIERSYKAGCMKPDARIFRDAERRFGINPDETVFLDDSQANCDAAAALGFKTICVHPGSEFMDLLSRYPGVTID